MKGLDKLKGVDQKLIDLVTELDKNLDNGYELTISEGLRTMERQKQLFKEKKTKTLNSKHLIGKAVDVYPIKDRKIDWDYFPKLINIAKKINNVDFTYGYDFGWDSPHIELKK